MDREDPDGITRDVAALLAQAGLADPGGDAVAITQAAAGAGPDAATIRARAMELGSRRAEGVPLSVLVGHQKFMGLDLEAGPGVFVVREETELLATEIVRLLKDRISEGCAEPRFIDMGCGSGNISCGVAMAVPSARIFATDLLDSCVTLTRRNVERHGLLGRVQITQGDLFAPLGGLGLQGSVDVVAMNPPYIASVRLATDRSYLVAHEPREAFDGGPFGISMLQRLIKETPPFLRPGGWLLFEFGVGQDRQIKMLVERSRLFSRIDFARNQAGEARAALVQK